jgi:hypothetical protein
VVVAIAIRRLQTKAAHAAFTRAGHAACEADIVALTAGIKRVRHDEQARGTPDRACGESRLRSMRSVALLMVAKRA